MSYRAYIPRRGDIVHLNFSPSAGHEMADRHYALVLSNEPYNRRTGRAFVTPITSRVRGWPFEVPVPAGLLPAKRGTAAVKSILHADVARHIDYREREVAYVSTAPRELVEEVLDKLLTVLEEAEPTGR
jgi:mRNA interferase MazF